MSDDRTAERWLPVVGHEGFYEVSDLGRVRGVGRRIEKRNGQVCLIKPKLLRLTPTEQGYVRVALAQEAVIRYVRVHTLVLEAFVGPCPDGQESLHRDDVGTNNALTNLRWGTPTQNRFDCVGNGHHHYAKRSRCRRGHAFVGPNLSRRTDGARRCRSCKYADDVAKEARRYGRPAPDRQKVADDFYSALGVRGDQLSMTAFNRTAADE